MRFLYIIKVGTTFPAIAQQYGDFEDWTRVGLALSTTPVKVVNVQGGELLPSAEICAGVVVTGSHDMVTERLAWSTRVERWLPSIVGADVPFLGICYGHQLLAQAMGGEVGYHPGGPEAGTIQVNVLPECSDDPLFAMMPPMFEAHAVHEQTVLRLPFGAVRLAHNDFEPNQVFRLGKCAWGVQFHPEYDERIMRGYLLAEAEHLQQHGLNVPALLAGVRQTSQAARLLKSFGVLVEKIPLTVKPREWSKAWPICRGGLPRSAHQKPRGQRKFRKAK